MDSWYVSVRSNDSVTQPTPTLAGVSHNSKHNKLISMT